MGLFDWLKKKDDENIENEAQLEAVEEAADEANEEMAEEASEIEEATEEVVEEVIEEVVEEAEEVAEEIAEEADEPEAEVEEEKGGFFAKIKKGLQKTRSNIISNLEGVLKSFSTIDEELYEELEEALIMADIGVETSMEIINRLRQEVKARKVKEVEEVKSLIVEIIADILEAGNEEFSLTPPTVILVIGVNGVGKTTTIGKLANNFKNQGRSVMLAAADTFRAAAIDQLEIWGERNDVRVIKHQENSDPGAVVFDAAKAAKARGTDVLICDTAGRLHNKKNLMDELKKIFRIIEKEFPEAQLEVFLVLDATTGQNALQQAKLFKEVADITGIVLTKLDGTAKGGIVIAIKNELNIPVRYIGVGEGINDLDLFNASEFSKALFEEV